jgi:alkylation response protein AidB-like acyl-CoA dehydrogenase
MRFWLSTRAATVPRLGRSDMPRLLVARARSIIGRLRRSLRQRRNPDISCVAVVGSLQGPRILRHLCAARARQARGKGAAAAPVKITQIYEGTNQINRMVMARNLLK